MNEEPQQQQQGEMPTYSPLEYALNVEAPFKEGDQSRVLLYPIAPGGGIDPDSPIIPVEPKENMKFVLERRTRSVALMLYDGPQYCAHHNDLGNEDGEETETRASFFMDEKEIVRLIVTLRSILSRMQLMPL